MVKVTDRSLDANFKKFATLIPINKQRNKSTNQTTIHLNHRSTHPDEPGSQNPNYPEAPHSYNLMTAPERASTHSFARLTDQLHPRGAAWPCAAEPVPRLAASLRIKLKNVSCDPPGLMTPRPTAACFLEPEECPSPLRPSAVGRSSQITAAQLRLLSSQASNVSNRDHFPLSRITNSRY